MNTNINININNARLNEMKACYERAYNDIYTFSTSYADNTISLVPYMNSDNPVRNDIMKYDSLREALKRVCELPDTIQTVKQAIDLIDKLIAHYNLDEEVAVFTPNDDDYGALMNCLDIHPDYSVYNVTPLGEVSILYYEDRISAILIDNADVDDILGAMMDLNWALKRMKRS